MNRRWEDCAPESHCRLANWFADRGIGTGGLADKIKIKSWKVVCPIRDDLKRLEKLDQRILIVPVLLLRVPVGCFNPLPLVSPALMPFRTSVLFRRL